MAIFLVCTFNFKTDMSKIEQRVVENLLERNIGFPRPNVLCGPRYGVDCALVELDGGKAMALASDPLSYIPSIGIKESAFLSIHLTANDIATTGFSPQYGQFVLNLPVHVSDKELEDYWIHIGHFAEEVGLNITGGHTSFDSFSQSTLAGGVTMITIAERDKMLLASQAQEGDVLLMTKSAALISTSILAMAFPKYVERHVGKEIWEKAISNFWSISVLPEAGVVQELNAQHKHIHAMHDVTEGGVLGAAYEFAEASRLGLFLWEDLITVDASVAEVARLFGLNPLQIVGAGSMLMACAPQAKDTVIEKFLGNGIPCAEIGYFSSWQQGKRIQRKNGLHTFTGPTKDLYWEVFAKYKQDEIS